VVWPGTRRTDWECEQLEKVPHIWIGNVDGLERCPHYVRNSNRRHKSETRAKATNSDLGKGDMPTSMMSETGSVEGKKEVIFFSAHLS
jgi:hypothetical protein